MIVRKEYINKLLNFKDKNFIKVVTGLRRVGKSTLLDHYINELINMGISKNNILKLNFELPNTFDIRSYRDLTNYVLEWSSNKEGKLYLILDEVGRVESWEKAVNAFHSMRNFDIYITGSNADLLSSELSTYLAGRYVEILMYPLSYKEFRELNKNATFNDYIKFGGIPSISQFNLDYDLSMNILRDSYNSAILKDVVQRYNIRNVIVLEKLIKYIFSNTSKTFSANSISKYFKSENVSISVDAILSYLKYLEDAFLIYRVGRNDLLSKKILKTEEKYFICDHGIREAIIGNNNESIELILENIIYIELKRRGYEVFIGKVGDKEIDFVAIKNNIPSYYQVSYLMNNEVTRNREFGVYKDITDNYLKVVLSLDNIDFSQNGIIHKNIKDFLLE